VITPGVSDPASERALFLMNRDGTDLRQVATIDAERPWLDVRWVTEGTLLAVHESAGVTPPVRTYFRIDVITGAVTEVDLSNPPSSADPRILTGQVSPDGQWVAYENEGLYLWHTTSGVSILLDATGRAAQWSFEGRELLFAAEREGEGHPFWRLYDVTAGTTNDLPQVGLWAQWLPDGRIVHSGWRCPSEPQSGITGSMDVSIFSPDSDGAETLTNTPEVSEPEGRGSPVGDSLAYFAAGDPYTLVLVDLTSGTKEAVVEAGAPGEPFHVHDGQWSPDGRYLQFTYGFAHGICD
jgi:Tol biopolymer transport system component